MFEQFLLSGTPNATHRVHTNDDLSAGISLNIKFGISPNVRHDLLWFLESVFADETVQHAYRYLEYAFTYDPASPDLHKFVISHNTTGWAIPMSLSSAHKLFDALSGYSKDLIKEN